jgi:hypothetical protein
VVHGDLHEDNLLIDDGRVTAITGWTDLRVGDPADDMAWLVASNEPDFVDSVIAAYHEAREEPVDPHLLRRAALAAEFALAQYLVKALALGDRDAAADGEDMLQQLASDIEAQDAAEAAEREAAEREAAERAAAAPQVSPRPAAPPMPPGAPGARAPFEATHPSQHSAPTAEGAAGARALITEGDGAKPQAGPAAEAEPPASNAASAEPPTDAIPLIARHAREGTHDA